MSEDKAVCVIFLAGCRLCFWPCFVPSPTDHRLYGTYSPSRVHWSLHPNHPISKLLGGCERCLSCAPNMRKLSFGDSATLVGNPTTAALAAPTSLSRDIVTSKHVWTDLAFMLNLFGLSKYVKNLRGVRLLRSTKLWASSSPLTATWTGGKPSGDTVLIISYLC